MSDGRARRALASCLSLAAIVSPSVAERQTTDPHAQRADRRHPPRCRRRRSLPLARGRDVARGAALDRRAERAHAQGARRVSRPQGARGSVLAALRDRLARRAGAAPQGESSALFLHAPRRQAEPAGALRARRARRRRPRARRRERAGRRRHARARLVGAVGGRRAGRLRRLRRRQRGVGAARARRRHRARPARRDRAHARLLAGLVPRRQGLLLHALPDARAACRPARRSTTAASFATAWATIRRATRRSSAPGAISRTGPASRCRPTAAGSWCRSTRAGRRARSTCSTCTRPARRRSRRSRSSTGSTPSSTSSRCSTIASTSAATRTRRAAACSPPTCATRSARTGRRSCPRARRSSRARPCCAARSPRSISRTRRRACGSSRSTASRSASWRCPASAASASLSNERHGDELFLSFTSFLTPTMILREQVGGAKGSAPVQPSVWRQLAAPIDPTAFEVEQVRYTSRDGTQCPLFLVHKRGALARDGNHPTLLYGYGGFNVNILPHWEPQVAPFLEHGGVYAVAILRGGGEYGEAWHQAGMLRAQAERLRRFHRRRRVADSREDHRARAPGDLGTVERRPADRRDHHPAARAVPRGDLRRAAAGHDPLPPLSDRAALDSRVRFVRGSRAVQMAVRVLALSSRQGRRRLSGGADSHGGVRHARRSDARAQDDRAAAGSDRPAGRCCCVSRARPATAPASRWER